VLRRNNWLFERRVKNAAPAIRDRQNAVRAQSIANAAGERTLFVNPKKARYAHEGARRLFNSKKGSTFLEEETEFQHITTAIGYYDRLRISDCWPNANGALWQGFRKWLALATTTQRLRCKHSKRWKRARDVAAGSDEVKAGNEKYLPRLEAHN
jgi:hypothetical protein